MNALVSMHGIWLLVFAPIAAVVAWRYSGPSLRKVSFYAMAVMGMVLTGWFGYLAIEGAEYTTTMLDRVMHSVGVMFTSINFPILQALLATVIVNSWPRRFEFKSLEPVGETESESIAS